MYSNTNTIKRILFILLIPSIIYAQNQSPAQVTIQGNTVTGEFDPRFLESTPGAVEFVAPIPSQRYMPQMFTVALGAIPNTPTALSNNSPTPTPQPTSTPLTIQANPTPCEEVACCSLPTNLSAILVFTQGGGGAFPLFQSGCTGWMPCRSHPTPTAKPAGTAAATPDKDRYCDHIKIGGTPGSTGDIIACETR
jgi:hypothetical protein